MTFISGNPGAVLKGKKKYCVTISVVDMKGNGS
jgi:hypothetical protein